ncbi:MAG: hypothetical protein AB9880_05310 [Christensenellales bacterium]
MKRIAEAARLEAAIYLKTGKVILPLLALLAFLLAFYSVGPVDIVSSTVLSALALSLISAWTGISFSRSEEPVVSQLIQLKLGSHMHQTASHALLLLAFGAAASALSTAWPLLKHAAIGGKFFRPAIGAADVAGMLSLFFSVSVMGAAYGCLFHPRILRDTRAAWLISLTGCLLGTFSGAITLQIPAFSYIAPLLPPIYSLITRFNDANAIVPSALNLTIAECWLYAAAAFMLKAILLRRMRY